MNTSIALLLGSLCLSSNAYAQDDDTVSPALGLQIMTDGYRVSGGEPGAPCIILIGAERGLIMLPGATLGVNPLLILWDGEFDADGEHRWRLPAPVTQDDMVSFYIQAVTVNSDLSQFTASPLVHAEFNGATFQKTQAPDDDTQPVVATYQAPEQWATRRLAVA